MEIELVATEIVVGTYTERLPHVDGKAQGILSCSFDGDTLGAPRALVATRNPSFVVLNQDGSRLYAVNEVVDFEGQSQGGVSAYSRDPLTGDVTPLNSRPSGGLEPAHLALSPSGRFLLVANYGSGTVAVFALDTEGRLGAMTALAQHEGGGPHPVRQSSPHAHMVAFDPVTGNVLVPDLGIDAVVVYSLSDSGQLEERRDLRVDVAAGAGPRHLAFHPGGEWLLLVNELDNTVRSLRREGDAFSVVDVASTLPASFEGHSQAAAVRVSPSGRWVIVSNRGAGQGSVAVLRFDEAKGSLEIVQVEPARGEGPREITFTPDGRRLLVANQDSNNVSVFGFDDTAGRLSAISTTEVPTPTCLQPTRAGGA